MAPDLAPFALRTPNCFLVLIVNIRHVTMSIKWSQSNRNCLKGYKRQYYVKRLSQMTSPTVLSLMLFHFIFLFILSYAENTSFLQLSLFKICFFFINFFFIIKFQSILIYQFLVWDIFLLFFFLLHLLLIQKEIKK